MTPIHVLCPNFTEIVCREVDETMRCFGDKKVRETRFFGARLAENANSLQGSVPRLSVKFGPNRFRFAGVIPETCDFVRSHHIYVFVI